MGQRRACVLSTLVPVLLVTAVPVWAQEQEQKWTWTDRDAVTRTREDLDEILLAHRRFKNNRFGSFTEKADLSGANLSEANLSEADLSEANLRQAMLYSAHLSGAILWYADLREANLSEANLRQAMLYSAHLDKALLRGAKLGGASLSEADLSGADLRDANLVEAELVSARLIGTYLFEADLSGADLRGANLSGVKLGGRSSNLRHAIFEPISNPLPAGMATTSGLELVTYATNSGPLSEMRKSFRDLGFRDEERKLTFALRSKAAGDLLRTCRLGIDDENHPYDRAGALGRANACGFYLLNWVGFDLTSQYGMTPGRPPLIGAFLWAAFSLLYATFIHHPGPSGLYVVLKRPRRGYEQTQGAQIVPRVLRPRRGRGRSRYLFFWLSRELRVLRAAMMFSLMSAFNIGFREVNFGRWMRLLMTREYDIKPVGWARPVSGVQSLITVYLVALWVLTYFGRPFDQ